MKNFHKADLGFDLGNSKYSIWIKDQGIVANESPYLAFSGSEISENKIVAIGSEAKKMQGKTPPGISVVCPMHEGVIKDKKIASLILKHMARKLGINRWLKRPRIVVGTLYGASEIEKKAFIEVVETIRSSRLFPIDEPLAAANGIGIDISEPTANMIVDIGDGATEVIVVSMGQIVAGDSIRLGGEAIENAITKFAKTKHGIILPRYIARQIKEDLPKIAENKNISTRVSGTDFITSMPAVKIVLLQEFLNAVETVLSKIIQLVLKTLNDLPAELSSDLITNGIYLCGGGALTATLKEQISISTQLRVNIAQSPQDAVIRGCQNIILSK